MSRQFQLVVTEEKSNKLLRVAVKAKTAWRAILSFVRKSVQWIEKADKLIIRVVSELASHGVFNVEGDRRRVKVKKVEENSSAMKLVEEEDDDQSLPPPPPTLKRSLTTPPITEKKAKKTKKAKKAKSI